MNRLAERQDPPAAGAAPRSSLASALLRRLIPPVLVLFALSAAIAYLAARHEAHEVQDHWLVDSVEALVQRVHLEQGRPALDLPEAARQIVQWDSQDQNWFALRGERSGHVAGEAGIPDGGTARIERLREARLYDGRIEGKPVRVAAIPVRLPGATEAIELRVAETLGKRNRLTAGILLSVLMPQLLLALIASAVIGFTLRQLVTPIGAVARALETQTHQSLEPVDDRALPSEVAPLTHSVNTLLLRLQDALAAQRHFIADAAHQLRTPLTALKLHADEAARETDPARLRTLIAEVQLAADRAVRLSNQLLSLARAEPSHRIGEPQVFDLRELAFEAAGRWVPQALRAGMDLGFDEASGPNSAGVDTRAPLRVSGHADLLAEALHNLIDNAIAYGRPGGRITVSVMRAGASRLQLRVDDDGPGIPESERERVLQRFHRGHPAEDSNGRATPGSGLGLAIVADIARAHGGSVRIADGLSGRGACVIVDLPEWTEARFGAEGAQTPATVSESAARAGAPRTPADAA